MQEINISAIVDYLIKHLNKLQIIYLFGFYASGYANKNSDIDIAVLFSERLSFKFKAALFQELALLAGKAIDLVELRYADTFLQEKIILTGQRIGLIDKKGCEWHEDYIYSAALDFRKSFVEEIIARGSIRG